MPDTEKPIQLPLFLSEVMTLEELPLERQWTALTS